MICLEKVEKLKKIVLQLLVNIVSYFEKESELGYFFTIISSC